MQTAWMAAALRAEQQGYSAKLFLTNYSKWIGGARIDVEMQHQENHSANSQHINRNCLRANSWFVPGLTQKQKQRPRPLFLLTIFGVADGARTHDNRNHNPGLYQLSYNHR